MKLKLEINNKTDCRFGKDFFLKVVSLAVKKSAINLSQKINLSLAIVSNQEIKNLNKKYRKKDKITDILSFSDYNSKNKKKEKEDIFCEIIICHPYIQKSSQEDGISMKKELAYVVAHGMLHCLGFEHGKKMYEIQDEVADFF